MWLGGLGAELAERMGGPAWWWRRHVHKAIPACSRARPQKMFGQIPTGQCAVTSHSRRYLSKPFARQLPCTLALALMPAQCYFIQTYSREYATLRDKTGIPSASFSAKSESNDTTLLQQTGPKLITFWADCTSQINSVYFWSPIWVQN